MILRSQDGNNNDLNDRHVLIMNVYHHGGGEDSSSCVVEGNAMAPVNLPVVMHMIGGRATMFEMKSVSCFLKEKLTA